MDSFPYIKREHWEKMGQVHILFISFFIAPRELLVLLVQI